MHFVSSPTNKYVIQCLPLKITQSHGQYQVDYTKSYSTTQLEVKTSSIATVTESDDNYNEGLFTKEIIPVDVTIGK